VEDPRWAVRAARVENGMGKSCLDRHRIPYEPTVYRFGRKKNRNRKNWQERERKELRAFPDRFRGYHILNRNSRRFSRIQPAISIQPSTAPPATPLGPAHSPLQQNPPQFPTTSPRLDSTQSPVPRSGGGGAPPPHPESRVPTPPPQAPPSASIASAAPP